MTPEAPASRLVDRSGLRDRVYDVLLRLILDGVMAPGERLTIDTLAKRLELSPTPVREALIQLERTGLVVREALKGYRVAPPMGRAEVEELFDARLLLEVAAAERVGVRAAHGDGAAMPVSSQGADGLTGALARAEDAHAILADRILTAGAAPSPEARRARFEADLAFHRVVVEHGGNRFVVELWDDLGPQFQRLRQVVATSEADVAAALDEHGAIVRAVRSGEPGRAVDALRRHLVAERDRAVAQAPG